MFKMTVHITQSFETEQEALEMYDEIVGEVKAHEQLHLNCQVTKKFKGYNPTFPDGREVKP